MPCVRRHCLDGVLQSLGTWMPASVVSVDGTKNEYRTGSMGHVGVRRAAWRVLASQMCTTHGAYTTRDIWDYGEEPLVLLVLLVLVLRTSSGSPPQTCPCKGCAKSVEQRKKQQVHNPTGLVWGNLRVSSTSVENAPEIKKAPAKRCKSSALSRPQWARRSQ